MIKQCYLKVFRKNKWTYAAVLWSILLGYACDTAPEKSGKTGDTFTAPTDTSGIGSIPFYDMNDARLLTLPDVLNEISGICFSEKGVLVAQNDEQGKVFFLNRQTAKIDSSFIFGKGSDYEDIVWVKDTLFLLQSNGNLHKVFQRTLLNSYTFPKKKGEFEALYFDSSLHQLVILCKRCEGNTVNAYAFSLNNQSFSSIPLYSLNVSEWQQTVGSKRIQPSAAAIQPLNGKLYILCSVGKCIFMATTNGKVEAAFRLNEHLFQQPEGLAFDEKGNMYISNESNAKNANIILIPYASK